MSNSAAAHLWPLFDLRLKCGDVTLRPMREAEVLDLAPLMPDDVEHDPTQAMLPGLSLEQNRRRLFVQGKIRHVGTWSIDSWCLDFGVWFQGRLVGEQTLEGEQFPELRTVDSASWLVSEVRGLGVGVAMRTAVLGLAFDHLGAAAAISSARVDNGASLGVSRHLGYGENGVSLSPSPTGVCELQHVRLTVEEWRASGCATSVDVAGLDGCGPYFGVDLEY